MIVGAMGSGELLILRQEQPATRAAKRSEFRLQAPSGGKGVIV
jgi:hypothetical protein